MSNFPILMYHRIVSETCPVPGGDPEEERYALSAEEFLWQMDRIKSLGYKGVSVGDALAAASRTGVPLESVVLTFDDGNLSDVVHALPLLRERNFSATFFVSMSRIGADGGLEEDMIRSLVSNGMEIGSHGMTHRFLSLLSKEEEDEECRASKQALSEISGTRVRYFAPPGGRYRRRTIQLLKRLGYEAACTSRFGYNSASAPAYALKRMPVHGGVRRDQFHSMVTRSVIKLLPRYSRAMSIGLIRAILGERVYGKARAVRRGN